MTYPLIPLLTLIISSTYSPGPNNLMCMILGQKIGFKRSFKYIIGACLGYSCLLVCIYLFNAILYNLLPSIDTVLGIVGAFYLSYLAWGILKGSKNKSKKNDSLIPENKLLITSFLIQFINPKASIFGLMIFSTFVFPYFQDITKVSYLILGLVLTTASSLCLWSGCGVFLNRFLVNHEKKFNMVMALALLYCAFSISGINKFFLS